jgi:hypothetical protein
MDPAIQKVQNAIDLIQRDDASFRAYLGYEKAERDEISRVSGARQEEKIAIARKALAKGATVEYVADITGLDADTITRSIQGPN